MNRRIGKRVPLLAAVMALAACSQEPPEPAAAVVAPAEVAPADLPREQPPESTGLTIGGDGSEIHLSALEADAIEQAALHGELACGFSQRDQLLLLARGDVASQRRAEALVTIGSYPERLVALADGGFDTLTRGGRFGGKGTVIAIAVTGDAVEAGESPARPATLTFDRADGARLRLAGLWRCGP